MMTKTAHKNIVPYDLIVKAASGDIAAINSVISLYEPYINKLAITKCIDEFGVTRYVVDDEAAGRMKSKLISKILAFDVAPKPTQKAFENGLDEEHIS